MIRSYDPSGPYEFPDSYEDEPPQAPAAPSVRCLCGNIARTQATLSGKCRWCGGVVLTEERYQELMRHWGAVAKARKVKHGGST